MLHQWFTCVHLLDTYLANLKEGFQMSFHHPSVSIRAAQSGLQSAPACLMRWVCHHLFRSYDRNPSNIANIRLHFCLRTHESTAKVILFFSGQYEEVDGYSSVLKSSTILSKSVLLNKAFHTDLNNRQALPKAINLKKDST